jgi:hypothetical protein
VAGAGSFKGLISAQHSSEVVLATLRFRRTLVPQLFLRIAPFSSRNERVATANPRPSAQICDRTEEDESADSPATTLALLLLSGAPPLHASLGPAPQCRPLASQDTETVDVKPSLTADGEVILRFDAEDRDFMIRTIVFEAASEPEGGKDRGRLCHS